MCVFSLSCARLHMAGVAIVALVAWVGVDTADTHLQVDVHANSKTVTVARSSVVEQSKIDLSVGAFLQPAFAEFPTSNHACCAWS